MTRRLRTAIVGGGIGGLTLALALRQRGIEANVYEQAPELTEIGAAIALSANSSRELRRLGMLDALTASARLISERSQGQHLPGYQFGFGALPPHHVRNCDGPDLQDDADEATAIEWMWEAWRRILDR
jgi:glycine/D-amino acid oxidase-like deaminating enzyme